MNSSSLIFGAFVSRTSLTAKVYAVTLSLLVAFMPFAGVFVPVSVAEAASPGDVIINEVMPNPIGSDATGEYVQLKNETAGTVNLNNWTLDIDGTTFTLPNTGGSFASGNTYNICRDASASSTAAVSCDTEMTSMSLHNSNAVRIELRDQSDKLIDLFEYNNGGGSIGDDEKPVNEYEGTLEGDHMITICHWDDEESTYNQITVDTNGLNGHGIHGDDIIPPFGDDEFENGQNWDDDGQAIYNNDCGNYEEEEEEEEEIEQCTEASQRWADSVVSFNQGNQNGGASVLGDRSDETKAVGPEDIEDRGEGDPSTIDYVSLGFGGSIILKFDQAIPDRAGDDLRIYETSYPLDPTSPAVNSYKERAEVWASATGTSPSDFKFLGEVTLDTVGDANTVNTVDLAVGGLSEARYVKIVDVSNPNHFNDSADGFDVAGVEGLTCGNDDPDPENDHALSLSGHKFNNLNGDRDQDDGEENLGAGWVFNLYLEDELGDWQHIDQATTTESGVFQFTPQLQDAGTYHICEVLQDGWSQVKQDWSGTPYHIVTDNESSNSDEGPWCRTIVYTDEADRSNKSYFGNQQISDDYTHQECAVPQTGDVEEDAEVLDAPSGEDDLQEILDDNYSGIDVNDDSTGYQTWSGENQTLTFNITLLATEADSTNTFGYYTNGDTSTFTPLFVSTIGDGHTKSVSIPLVGSTDVGFAIENNEGIWPTEIGAGDFPGDHAVTYHVGDGTYVIGFEDSNKYDDDDFNDVVVEIEVTSCHGHLECAIPGLENDDDAEVLNAPSGEDDLQEILDAESYVVDVNDDS
ncbi:MAG: lamin tail domain-containing protein, partial [Candidatus Paceibacterota bacterium]